MAGRRRARLAKAAALYIGVAALAGITAACGASRAATGNTGNTGNAVSEPAGTISESGSGLLDPLAKSWAAAYQRQHPGVTVTTASTGSSMGISLASAGKVDIGASDAYLSSGDLVKNPALLNIPLAISAQTIIYNVPGLSQGSHIDLDGEVLAEIYNGTVTTWNDPAITGIGKNKNLNLPAMKIVPVHRSDGSGDTFLFTSYLSTNDQTWDQTIGYGTTAAWPPVSGAEAEKGSVNTMNTCESTPGCIAYNGISYLSPELRSGKIGYAALANNAGQYKLPTAAAIQSSVSSFVSLTPPNETMSIIDGPSATGYPIVNFEYAIVSTRQPDAARANAIKAFLNWAITTGNDETYLQGYGFQPLPGAVVTLGERQVGEIGS
ncbi:MAG TPA: phosphate ABC transporter substrate-binding protein PstS [Trebonia sp.]|nr:phosphate ABC transporter substrate-binding protein PstS [Trebonia sp.]